ncbi:serine hydrolase-domain-containing protein [Pelagophyceae sp. CCMP2097]|nr:serine hydrolase-domain-containing protein [Pelagophyceae sp. CCMP2097]
MFTRWLNGVKMFASGVLAGDGETHGDDDLANAASFEQDVYASSRLGAFQRKPLRLLALHGRGSNNDITLIQMGALSLHSRVRIDVLTGGVDAKAHNSTFELLSQNAFRQWWAGSPTPEKLLSALKRVLKVIDDFGPYDGIYGFSQGAAVASFLSADGAIDRINALERSTHRRSWRFVICAGGVDSGEDCCKSLLGLGSEDKLIMGLPSLHLIGDRDYCKPMSMQLAANYAEAVVLHHDCGHEVPLRLKQDSALQAGIKKQWTGDGAAVADSCVRRRRRELSWDFRVLLPTNQCSRRGCGNMQSPGASRSDLDKDARKAAAQGEAAWAGAGAEPGIEIFRAKPRLAAGNQRMPFDSRVGVEKMKVVPWPKEEYGKFYAGDSYIILSTKKDGPKLVWDIHFWLGETTSQDEMGIAAYKSVELDDLLDQAPIQHREVMKHESVQFSKLFKQVEYLEGGVKSGFNHVEAGTYVAKLLQVKKTKHTIKVIEVPCTKAAMNQGDCYILDAGHALYSWFGENASAFEKAKCGTVASNIANSRHGKTKVVMHLDADFWAALGGEGEIKESDGGALVVDEEFGEGILYKLSDESGKLMCTEVARGELSKDMLGSEDVYLVDAGLEVFVYVGSNASDQERRNAMSTAVSYLGSTGKPLHTPLHLLKQGSKVVNEHWNKIFAN